MFSITKRWILSPDPASEHSGCFFDRQRLDFLPGVVAEFFFWGKKSKGTELELKVCGKRRERRTYRDREEERAGGNTEITSGACAAHEVWFVLRVYFIKCTDAHCASN